MRKKKEMKKTITTVSCRIQSASWNREGCYSLEDALSGPPSAFMKRMNGHHFVSYFNFFLSHWFMFFFLSLILKCHIRKKNFIVYVYRYYSNSTSYHDHVSNNKKQHLFWAKDSTWNYHVFCCHVSLSTLF